MNSNKWISEEKFKTITKGDYLEMRFMMGDAIVQSEPNLDKYTLIVEFKTKPWKEKGEILVVRQQIKKIK